MTAIDLLGERLVLRPDRSLAWPARRTLLIADPHFGKAAAFRAAGVPVPGGPEEPLRRLGIALAETAAERLVVLGDFWHAPEGQTADTLAALAAWRSERPALRIDLVRGNHDRGSAPAWADGWRAGPVAEWPFALAHYPEPSDAGYVLAGHLHPGVELSGPGRQRLRLACFRFGPRVGVLPAFGDFTGLAAAPPGRGERVFAVAGGEVVEVSPPVSRRPTGPPSR